jgi:hypothetical protein
MSTKRALGSLAGVLAAVILGTPGIAGALELQADTRYAGRGQWQWTVSLAGTPTELEEIRCVRFAFAGVTPRSREPLCDPKNGFGVTADGDKDSVAEAAVQFKDGRTETLRLPLALAERRDNRLKSIAVRNWARAKEPGWWDWGVFIDGAPEDVAQVRCVEYTLHPTFPDPVRTVCDSEKRFELSASGWGTFQIAARLLLTDGTVQSERHQLTFSSDSGAAASAPSLLGVWRIERWEEPRPPGVLSRLYYKPQIVTGSLDIDKQLDANTYQGVMTVQLGRAKVTAVEELEITVADRGAVTMLGTVISGNRDWTDDRIEVTWNGETLTGTARDRHSRDRAATTVRFTRDRR